MSRYLTQALRAARTHAAMLAVTSLFLVVSILTFDQIEEDAFIYFRFARNLANGHGYVFNVGGERIESGSSLLWQLLLVGVWVLPLNMIVKAKLFGMGFGVLALVLTDRIGRRLGAVPWAGWAPALLLACSAPFFCWSQRGLETSFYLCTLLWLCDVCCDERRRRYWPWAAILVCASRPEGFVMLVALLPFLYLQHRRNESSLRGLGLLALLFGFLTLGRLAYFHDPVPHPFHLKASTGVVAGGMQVFEYGIDHGLVLLLALAIMGYARRDAWGEPHIIVASFAVVTGVWAMIAMEGLAPYFRHIVPALAFFFLLTIAGLARLARERVSTFAAGATIAAFAIAMLLFSRSHYGTAWVSPSVFSRAAVVALSAPGEYVRGIAQIFSSPSQLVSNIDPTSKLRNYNAQGLRDPINTSYQASAGKFVRLNYPENITFVYDQMGQTPWYAGFDKRVIDSYGLVTKTVGYHRFQRRKQLSGVFRSYDAVMVAIAGALWPEENRRVSAEAAVDYIFEQNAELILINEYGLNYSWNIPSRISRDPRLEERYRPAYLLDDIVRIYERKDLPTKERVSVPPGAGVNVLRSASPG